MTTIPGTGDLRLEEDRLEVTAIKGELLLRFRRPMVDDALLMTWSATLLPARGRRGATLGGLGVLRTSRAEETVARRARFVCVVESGLFGKMPAKDIRVGKPEGWLGALSPSS